MHYQTNLDKILTLLFEKSFWNITEPNLIISVTGGAKLNKIKPELKDKFSKGLVKVATTTNALVTTGGTNSGCMKLVGEAFKNNSLSSDLDKRVTLLGIANWGSVTNNTKLIRNEVNFSFNLLTLYEMISFLLFFLKVYKRWKIN